MEAKKRWEVESKLPIKSLWERWEGLAWVLSRNNTGKELVPHLEGGGRSLSSEDLATDQLFPLVLFFRRKKKKAPFLLHLVVYMYLDKMPVFCGRHHYVLWGDFGIFLRAEIPLKAGFSCLGCFFGSLTCSRLLTETVKWPWSLEPRGNSPANQDQAQRAKVGGRSGPHLGCGMA